MEATSEREAHERHVNRCVLCRSNVGCSEEAGLYSAWEERLRQLSPDVASLKEQS
jgi:hypothetical protein